MVSISSGEKRKVFKSARLHHASPRFWFKFDASPVGGNRIVPPSDGCERMSIGKPRFGIAGIVAQDAVIKSEGSFVVAQLPKGNRFQAPAGKVLGLLRKYHVELPVRLFPSLLPEKRLGIFVTQRRDGGRGLYGA